MSSQLHEQLREASVYLTAAQEGVYATAVEKLVATNPSIDDQLARLRLAFQLDPGADACTRFDEQLATAGAQVDVRQVQLRRTLAAAVLTARFGRAPGRRSLATLAPDTAAALGARILARGQRVPVHPDVITWADYWVDSLAMHLREPGRLPAPPLFAPTLPTPEPESTADEASAQRIAALQTEFSAFAEELGRWSSELDPAELRAQGEQIDLLWWLEGGSAPEACPELVIWAAQGLRRHTRRIPGPPRTDQLLHRRLGDAADEPVDVQDVADHAQRPVPEAVADLCLLLTADAAAVEKRSLGAVTVAEWLFDELSLVDLIEMAR